MYRMRRPQVKDVPYGRIHSMLILWNSDGKLVVIVCTLAVTADAPFWCPTTPPRLTEHLL